MERVNPPSLRYGTMVSSRGSNTATYSYLANSPLAGQITFAQTGRTRMTTLPQHDYLNRLTSIASASSLERVKGEAWDRWRDRHGDAARDMLLYLGQRLCGMKLKELAAESGLENYGSVAMAIKRYGNKLARDADEAARMKSLIQMLNVKGVLPKSIFKQKHRNQGL
jgi:hypothetical protein